MKDWEISRLLENDLLDIEEYEYRNSRKNNLSRFYRNDEGELKIRKLNKFYVGAEHISRAIERGVNDDWTCKSEADAIAHAKSILEKDPSKQVCIVVEVKYIVRRTKPVHPPIKVERVK